KKKKRKRNSSQSCPKQLLLRLFRGFVALFTLLVTTSVGLRIGIATYTKIQLTHATDTDIDTDSTNNNTRWIF
ncbi:hypothetical protein OFB51_25545, partial [Escherichia coli]|nr:hypothetical protein [Escherichia coli]